MAKTKTKSRTSLISRLGGKQWAIVAAFALVFAGFGTWYVERSQAASLQWPPCVQYKLYQGTPLHGCVKQLQYVLQKAGAGSTCPTGYCDGIYGPITASAVSRFGSRYGLSNGGQMTNRTWIWLCNFARAYPTPVAASALGCSSGVPQSSYGEYN